MTSVLDCQVGNGRLPAWARIWVWALANANTHGHAPAYPGQKVGEGLLRVVDEGDKAAGRPRKWGAR